MSLLVKKKKKSLNLLNNKNFISAFKFFVLNIIKYERSLIVKENKNYSKLLIFFKIFFFWKFFIKLWNNLMKNSKKLFISVYNKSLKNFFMMVLLEKLKNIPKNNKKVIKNLKNYKFFFRQTYLLDLYLYWILHTYSDVIAHFYYVSFLSWLEFFFLSSDAFKISKILLNLKNLYNFKDLYKNWIFFNDPSYNYTYFVNFHNYNNFFSVIQKNLLFTLDLQFTFLKWQKDPVCTIFDEYSADAKYLYLKKEKKYVNFFSSFFYGHNARWTTWRRERRYFPRKKLFLCV